ncbi:protein mono-ADP-ribosyltransferase PARP10 [Pteronotus mesoamericanus]|uniref:protein mono-ADP-ribosyltransferase PARP10 n=1 Tax=Pteronotus mesoamericanus TaxID=1884717 RepID=UPI0023EBC279|nr:protein mono-ADP-ribosyltransferase PARP10 [Pteronotus parnellii mesoamericanus]
MAEAEEAGAAVELSGLSPNTPDELLMLYFENHRRSGGGPVLSWQRLGHGGVLTFREPADAASVLARKEHVLPGTHLSVRPAPPRTRARLLLQGLPPGTAPQHLEQHVQALLRAAGHPEQPCRALASPRPDRALVQLPKALSEAEARALEEQAQALGLGGAEVSLAWVPQARAVRVLGGASPVDTLLLELYLENERRSGGGPLEGLRSLPGQLGTVVTFRQWQVAERVLQQDHCLQGLELTLVPHYNVLEPEELAEDTGGGDPLAGLGPEATGHALLEPGGPARALRGVETVALGSEEALGQSGAPRRTDPIGPRGRAGPVILGPAGASGLAGLESPEPAGASGQAGLESPEPAGDSGQEGLESPEPAGYSGQEGLESPEPAGYSGQAGLESPEPAGYSGQEGLESPEPAGYSGSAEVAMGSLGQAGAGRAGHAGSPEQGGLVETVLPMEPGAMRFIQLYHEDLLAGLGEVALFPLEGADAAGFRLCGALAPCLAAQEFLQSLLGSINCHVLSLKHPGSARFLLGPEGQHLLQELEAQFQCVFGTERLDIDFAQVDLPEALQALPDQAHSLWLLDSTGSDQESRRLEEVQELLATLEGLAGEDRLSLAPEEEELEQQPEREPAPGAEEELPAPGTGAPGQLEEEAALQLALHRSLEPQGQVAEQEEAAALRQALALSLLEPNPLEAEEALLGGGAGGQAQLVVHAAFEQDMDELDRALGAALEVHLREETVGLRGHTLPSELRARLERCHGVSIALHNDRTVLRGFGVQPTCAAHHLAALLAGPRDPSLALDASSPTPPQQRLQGPLGRLEGLAESSREFQAVVQAFCDTLDTAHGRIRIVRVERVSHPLLEQQYELHRERLEQRCARRPVEHVLYHGTSAPAVADICAYGFNRSFCGRNGTLYGKGVYFAKRASLSVQNRYSPPNADGHKAVFVARVLTGDYGLGHRELRAPPLRAPGHGLPRYDSAVDCLRQPSIFVIFHDTQALPTHLITCEHMPQPSPGDPSGSLANPAAT